MDKYLIRGCDYSMEGGTIIVEYELWSVTYGITLRLQVIASTDLHKTLEQHHLTSKPFSLYIGECGG